MPPTPTPASAVAALLALARVRWGNLDADANKVFSTVESMLTAGAFAPSEAAAALVASMGGLIKDAIETHIYDTANGDKIPDGCPYTLAVAEAQLFVDAHGVFGPMPGSVQLIRDLRGTVADLTGQVEQMKGLFLDDDGAIQQALDDADETDLRAKLYLDTLNAGALRVSLTVEGGNVQSAWAAFPMPELTVCVYDVDVEDEDRGVYSVEFAPGEWRDARVDEFALTVAATPAQRERDHDDAEARRDNP